MAANIIVFISRMEVIVASVAMVTVWRKTEDIAMVIVTKHVIISKSYVLRISFNR